MTKKACKIIAVIITLVLIATVLIVTSYKNNSIAYTVRSDRDCWNSK